MSEYEFKSLSTPIRLTEDFLRSEAVKINMTPPEYLEKMRREWPVEIEKQPEGARRHFNLPFSQKPS